MNEKYYPKKKRNILRDLHFVEDIEKKIACVKNLNNTCIYESTQEEHEPYKSWSLGRAGNYVGCSDIKVFAPFDFKPPRGVVDISKMFKSTKWLNWMDEKIEIFLYRLTVDRKLRDLYLVKRILPCTEHLKHILKDTYLNPHSKYRGDMTKENMIKLLVNIGYSLQKVPGTNRGFIIEQASAVKERFTYLRKITQYREEGRSFVYVDKQNVTKSFGSMNETLMIIAISPEVGLINHIFLRGKKQLNTWQMASQNWLKNILPFMLPNNCVIVIDNKMYDQTFIDNNIPLEKFLLSSKAEMIAWLNTEGIPHKETMHKVELYELIQRHRIDHKPTFEIDAILESLGISVLRRPNWLIEFDYFSDFWKYLKSENFFPYLYSSAIEAEINFLDYVKQYPVWNVMEMELVKKEKLFMEEDGKIENIIENVMLMSIEENFLIENYYLINQLDSL